MAISPLSTPPTSLNLLFTFHSRYNCYCISAHRLSPRFSPLFRSFFKMSACEGRRRVSYPFSDKIEAVYFLLRQGRGGLLSSPARSRRSTSFLLRQGRGEFLTLHILFLQFPTLIFSLYYLVIWDFRLLPLISDVLSKYCFARS